MFEHLAYLAILAFGQRHLDPLIAPGAAFEIGVDLAIADAVDGDAEDQLFELRLADVAKGAGAIGAFDSADREFELALEFAVVGEEQQRSEEHTSELQSLMRTSYAVFFLKKKITILLKPNTITTIKPQS